jgi:hypothetical protein
MSDFATLNDAADKYVETKRQMGKWQADQQEQLRRNQIECGRIRDENILPVLHEAKRFLDTKGIQCAVIDQDNSMARYHAALSVILSVPSLKDGPDARLKIYADSGADRFHAGYSFNGMDGESLNHPTSWAPAGLTKETIRETATDFLQRVLDGRNASAII